MIRFYLKKGWFYIVYLNCKDTHVAAQIPYCCHYCQSPTIRQLLITCPLLVLRKLIVLLLVHC